MIAEGTNREVLTFTKGDQVAYIVTDGLHHMVATNGRKDRFYNRLSRAIANLEARGFRIVVDVFNSYSGKEVCA